MQDSADAVARAQLRPGEHLLWSGRPDRSRLFCAADAYLIPFGLIFVVISLSFMSVAGRGGDPKWMFGLIFLAIGVYFVVGRFVVKSLRQAATTYLVTDRRVVVVIGRRVFEGPNETPHQLGWARDRRHVNVVWPEETPPNRPLNPQLPPNTGFDGITQPQPLAFFDVPDPDALVAALDRVTARP